MAVYWACSVGKGVVLGLALCTGHAPSGCLSGESAGGGVALYWAYSGCVAHQGVVLGLVCVYWACSMGGGVAHQGVVLGLLGMLIVGSF